MSGIGVPSNAIGKFAIGISAIGTLPQFNYRLTLISQYANSPNLLQLLDNLNQYFDPTELTDEFFDKIWNIDTAEGYGLDIWGRIVGVNRVLKVSDDRFYGFFTGSGDTSFDPWNTSPFYTGSNFTNNFSLTDQAYRQLILAKAFANICDGSILSINALLRSLFGAQGKAYVKDNGHMSMTYKFEFIPTPVQYAILTQSGVFPQPTGVSVSIDIP